MATFSIPGLKNLWRLTNSKSLKPGEKSPCHPGDFLPGSTPQNRIVRFTLCAFHKVRGENLQVRGLKLGNAGEIIEVNVACRHIDSQRVTVSLQDVTQIQIKRCYPKNGLKTLSLKHALLGGFYSSDLYRSSGMATAVNVSPILAG